MHMAVSVDCLLLQRESCDMFTVNTWLKTLGGQATLCAPESVMHERSCTCEEGGG